MYKAKTIAKPGAQGGAKPDDFLKSKKKKNMKPFESMPGMSACLPTLCKLMRQVPPRCGGNR